MKHYLKLMRVHHYIKNFLVFAALLCSGLFFQADKLIAGIIGFVAFCVTSSIVYIINDIRDKEKDMQHPKKCKRPIASGKVPVPAACVVALVLAAVATGCSIALGNWPAAILLLAYLVLNLAYSFGLKNVPLVDVAILVSGFVIRVAYGAMVTGIEASSWLYLTVIACAFYFALGKRKGELVKTDGEARAVLKHYPKQFLDKGMTMCLTLANVFYALWSMDANTIAHYNNKYLIFTVPIVLLITLKYSLNIEGESDGDPVEVLLHDKVLLALCAIYAIAMFCILYI